MTDHDVRMSNLRHYLPHVLPGVKTSLEDVRYGDPVLVIATNDVVVGLFDSVDFTADEVKVHVVRSTDDDSTHSAIDSSVDSIYVYVLPHQMNIFDILVKAWQVTVTHQLIGHTCVWVMDSTALTRSVVGYVGYGYGEDDSTRVALEVAPTRPSELPDTYTLLEVIR